MLSPTAAYCTCKIIQGGPKQSPCALYVNDAKYFRYRINL